MRGKWRRHWRNGQYDDSDFISFHWRDSHKDSLVQVPRGHINASRHPNHRLYFLFPRWHGHQHPHQIVWWSACRFARNLRTSRRGSHWECTKPCPTAFQCAKVGSAQGFLQRTFGYEKCGLLLDDGFAQDLNIVYFVLQLYLGMCESSNRSKVPARRRSTAPANVGNLPQPSGTARKQSQPELATQKVAGRQSISGQGIYLTKICSNLLILSCIKQSNKCTKKCS